MPLRASRSSPLARVAVDLVEILLPSPCLACGEPTREWHARLGLCVSCRGRLCPLQGACQRCAEPFGHARAASTLCSGCRRHPPAFDRVVAAWIYQPPLDAVIRELKFGGLAAVAGHLADAMLPQAAGETADCVVPVPLHWRRLLRRGYDQALEIAHALARRRRLPLARAVRRRRRTSPQSTLPRDRRTANLGDAFAARPRSIPPGGSVLLVDDVMTTGSTLDACSRALRQAGAGRIVCVVAGRTPSPTWQGS